MGERPADGDAGAPDASGATGPLPDDTFEAAFRTAFAEHFTPLFRYLDRHTGDPALAADVAQETFITLFERGSMPDSARGWLVRVANNRVQDARRRAARRARLLRSGSADVPVARAPAPADAALIAAEWQPRVRAALDAMPERERQLLLLRAEGYSYRELATALALADASVGTLLARARAAFRASLEASLDGRCDARG